MENKEFLSTNIKPRFDGSNYTFYRIRMDVYLQSLGVDIWHSVVNGYKNSKTTLVEPTDTRLQEYNRKAKNSILYVIEDVEFTKAVQCTSFKDILNKLKSNYEGDEKVKKDKLYTFLVQFETMQMKQEGVITTHFLQFDEIVNSIKGLRETIK